MKNQLINLKNEAEKIIPNITCEKELESFRLSCIGKKGKLTSILKSLGSLSKEEKPIIGKLSNETKAIIIKLINQKKCELKKLSQQHKEQQNFIDITLPGRKVNIGHFHPITQITNDISHIFKRLGFSVADGPELEHQYYNFEALNIPQHHPARDEQDSFYITSNRLLRTQTSPVQIRVMEKQSPPISVISTGRCFRRDAVDATHSHTFHQIEGLSVDKNISFADLKGVLHLFAKEMFGANTKTRFRPDFFPFTEPSAEFAISCFICKGKGCKVCKGSTWIEIGGCGLVDPTVFSFVKIDPNEYSGYAFGMGIERLAMIKYGVPDIRMFYENDLKFLKQF